jgi:hypothetical protein
MNERSQVHAPVLALTEHLALIRQMARLQRQMDHVLAVSQDRAERQSAEIVRLRGQLLVARTAALWGMAGVLQQVPRAVQGGVGARAPQTVIQDAATRHVICLTGCVGHAHAWLDGAGHCQRDGEVCDRTPQGSADRPLGAAKRL